MAVVTMTDAAYRRLKAQSQPGDILSATFDPPLTPAGIEHMMARPLADPDAPSLVLIITAMRRELATLAMQVRDHEERYVGLCAKVSELSERADPPKMDRALGRLVADMD